MALQWIKKENECQQVLSLPFVKSSEVLNLNSRKCWHRYLNLANDKAFEFIILFASFKMLDVEMQRLMNIT